MILFLYEPQESIAKLVRSTAKVEKMGLLNVSVVLLTG
jgi:hypothetical protein